MQLFEVACPGAKSGHQRHGFPQLLPSLSGRTEQKLIRARDRITPNQMMRAAKKKPTQPTDKAAENQMFETAVPWFQLVVAEGAAAPRYVLSHCLVGWPVALSSPSAGRQKTAG